MQTSRSATYRSLAYAIDISRLPQVKGQKDQMSLDWQEYILLYTIFLLSFMTERSMAVVDLSIVCDLNETFFLCRCPKFSVWWPWIFRLIAHVFTFLVLNCIKWEIRIPSFVSMFPNTRTGTNFHSNLPWSHQLIRCSRIDDLKLK